MQPRLWKAKATCALQSADSSFWVSNMCIQVGMGVGRNQETRREPMSLETKEILREKGKEGNKTRVIWEIEYRRQRLQRRWVGCIRVSPEKYPLCTQNRNNFMLAVTWVHRGLLAKFSKFSMTLAWAHTHMLRLISIQLLTSLLMLTLVFSRPFLGVSSHLLLGDEFYDSVCQICVLVGCEFRGLKGVF